MAFLLSALWAAHSAPAQPCVAESGPQTTALVELYTSERCSACERAQQRLATLAKDRAHAKLIPLVLHVDERNYSTEAPDPLARRRLTLRQRLALLHAPALLLQGREFQAWAGPQLEQSVSRVYGHPAAARMRLEILASEPSALRVRARAELLLPDARDAMLYLAAYEERRGHNVALEWQGPFPLAASSALEEERRLALVPGAPRARSGVVGMVQEARNGAVLQALLVPAC